MLVADSHVAAGWRGSDDTEYDRVITHPEGLSAFEVGAGAGALIGDGVVRDDSWIEVFAAPEGGSPPSRRQASTTPPRCVRDSPSPGTTRPARPC